MPAKTNNGRSSFSANQTTSFLPVAGFASGAYSAKLFAGTKHRLSGFSQPRQCGEVVLRIAPREGWRYHHVQAIIVAIDQYAEAALGNREFFLNKPYGIGGGMKDDIPRT